MIGKLTGHVAETGDNWVLLDVGGVGYEIFCAPSVLAECMMSSGTIALYIDTHVRENEIKLYGFLSSAEKKWFVLLQSVQGVGAKVALAMLGALPTETLAGAISAGDTKTLATTPGVGPKVAQRIANELKDKVGDLAGLVGGVAPAPAENTSPTKTKGKKSSTKKSGKAAPKAPPGAKARADAVSALVNLGYAPAEASSAVQAAAHEAGDEASTEDLIRDGLKNLSA